MACIDDIVQKHFGAHTSATCVTSQLDIGLMFAGKQVQTLHDLVVHPSAAEIDHDAVAAGLVALLSHLGQMGGLIDALDEFARSVARGAVAAPQQHVRDLAA